MSILARMKALPVANNSAAKVKMNEIQIKQCKEALAKGSRGYNVQPNSFDIATPYRVSINYDDNWSNFGNFVSVDVAAAIGTIIASAFFGEKAKAGEFDIAKVENDPEFLAWMADSRNAGVISQASGEKPSVQDAKSANQKKCDKDMAKAATNPFATADDDDDDQPF